jgi:ankyrin repeat protein
MKHLLFPLLLLSLSIPSLAMKRETGEPEGEEKQPKKLKKIKIEEEDSAFEALPREIKVHILSFLVTAPGSTKAIRLHTAAENIRNFMLVNKEKYNLIQDQQVTGYLIRELAKRYTDNNVVAAALALRTAAAGAWLQAQNVDKKFETVIALKILNAAQEDQLPELSFLLKYFPQLINMVDPSNRTALVLAAFRGNTAIVEFLLKVPGIDVNIASRKGGTPLMFAAYNGHEAIVQLLLKAPGININARGADVGTALYAALAQGHLTIAERLLSVPNINVNLSIKGGSTPLMLAVNENYPEIVKRLLTMPNINVNKAKQDGGTALFFAIINGNVEIVKLLLEREGIAINHRSPSGYTALKYAKEHNIPNKEAIIKLLKEHGAVE